jgi:hypothetical protein
MKAISLPSYLLAGCAPEPGEVPLRYIKFVGRVFFQKRVLHLECGLSELEVSRASIKTGVRSYASTAIPKRAP